MRKDPLITGQYYHIYNRGVDKRDIFTNKKDLERFVLSVKEFNKKIPIGSLRDKTPDVGRLGENEDNTPLVSIVCYCFNPNHFHFILKQETDDGISEFFKRLLGGYTKYFNLTHNRNGALFQGRFKSKLIIEEGYFLRIRPYVNMNYLLHEIPEDKKNFIKTSDDEYKNNSYEIVSKKEAKELLDFYGDYLNFNKECLSVVSILREERGLVTLLEEDLLP